MSSLTQASGSPFSYSCYGYSPFLVSASWLQYVLPFLQAIDFIWAHECLAEDCISHLVLPLFHYPWDWAWLSTGNMGQEHSPEGMPPLFLPHENRTRSHETVSPREELYRQYLCFYRIQEAGHRLLRFPWGRQKVSLTRTVTVWLTNCCLTLLQIVAGWEQLVWCVSVPASLAARYRWETVSSGSWGVNGSHVCKPYGPFPERGETCPPWSLSHWLECQCQCGRS